MSTYYRRNVIFYSGNDFVECTSVNCYKHKLESTASLFKVYALKQHTFASMNLFPLIFAQKHTVYNWLNITLMSIVFILENSTEVETRISDLKLHKKSA